MRALVLVLAATGLFAAEGGKIVRPSDGAAIVSGPLDVAAQAPGDEEASEALEEGVAEGGATAAEAAEAVDGPPGSNSWALGSSRSGEVGAIVASDPHLGFSLPGIWYEVQLRAPDYEVAGMSLPGSPGFVIGQSDTLGWALTNVMLDSPSTGMWLAVRGVLFGAGLGSLGIAAAILKLEPRPSRGLRIAALTGVTLFCFQTVVLDALIWPALFPG